MDRVHIQRILANPRLHYNAHKILIELALVRTHEGFCAQSICSLMNKTLLKRNQIRLHLDTLRKKKILKVHRIRVSGKHRYAVYYQFTNKCETN